MATGTVKWFSDKGYGFIAPDDAQSHDLFVRDSGIAGQANGPLVESAKVSYDTTPSQPTKDRPPSTSRCCKPSPQRQAISSPELAG